MECLNFDERFANYLTQWMTKNAAKYGHKVERMEERVPEVYLYWSNRSADWLGGQSPAAYFAAYDDAPFLVRWLCQYDAECVPVPDLLLERIAALGETAEQALISLLYDSDVTDDLLTITLGMLLSMESEKAIPYCVERIASQEMGDEIADLAGEVLTALGETAAAEILEILPEATEEGQLTFFDILCHLPTRDETLALGMRLLVERRDQWPLLAPLLSRLGDARAVPVLEVAIATPDIKYLEYHELAHAIEALGGERPPDKDFSHDPDWKAIGRME